MQTAVIRAGIHEQRHGREVDAPEAAQTVRQHDDVVLSGEGNDQVDEQEPDARAPTCTDFEVPVSSIP
jgi:hypothetical protein